MNKLEKLMKWTMVFVLAALTFVAVLGFAYKTPRSYSFVTVDHPVDMLRDGKYKWAYYSLGSGKVTDVATKVRTELIPRGFVEDASQRPWYRFTKGSSEVVVCNHSEFGVRYDQTTTTLMHSSHPPSFAPSGEWPCVLVKNGPGTEMSIPFFNVLKLLRRW